MKSRMTSHTQHNELILSDTEQKHFEITITSNKHNEAIFAATAHSLLLHVCSAMLRITNIAPESTSRWDIAGMTCCRPFLDGLGCPAYPNFIKT